MTKYFQDNRTVGLDGCKLTHVSSAKFLEITVDKNLMWKSHINNVCKNPAKEGVLNKVKHFLPTGQSRVKSNKTLLH